MFKYSCKNFSEQNLGLPHTQGTQGNQGNSGKFKLKKISGKLR